MISRRAFQPKQLCDSNTAVSPLTIHPKVVLTCLFTGLTIVLSHTLDNNSHFLTLCQRQPLHVQLQSVKCHNQTGNKSYHMLTKTKFAHKSFFPFREMHRNHEEHTEELLQYVLGNMAQEW